MVAGCIERSSALLRGRYPRECTQTIDTSCAMRRKLCYDSLTNWLRCTCHHADEPILYGVPVGQKAFRTASTRIESTSLPSER